MIERITQFQPEWQRVEAKSRSEQKKHRRKTPNLLPKPRHSAQSQEEGGQAGSNARLDIRA